ncbi:hypothetical protein L596_022617 [Steinernema carpocapsae]|uniref:ShKT domain-containing protein n=1 Tax=Steinernema carpocapsae TaxID=34508 RepID=A0A4U5MMB7_STECR|nr:hypothetical protein L596_022617 [Steinernema carpocapsae]
MFSFSPLLLFVFLGIALGQDPPMPCGPRGQCPPDTTCENNFCILKVLPPNENPNESSIGDACGPAQPCSPPFSCINEKCNVQPDGTDVPGGDDTDFGPQCDPNNPNDGICNANEKCIVAQGETVAKCVASNDANVPAITPGPNPNPNPGQGTSQCAHDLDCGAGFRCSLTQGKCVSKGTPIRPVIPVDQWNNRRSGECVDKHAPGRASDCPQRKYLCEDRLYYDLMTVQCPYTFLAVMITTMEM